MVLVYIELNTVYSVMDLLMKCNFCQLTCDSFSTTVLCTISNTLER